VFTKLLGLFVLLLVIQAVAMEFVFQRAAARTAGEMLLLLGRDVLWSGLIALVIALPAASPRDCSAWLRLRGASPRAI
jgi:hypothetical protein